MARSRSFEPLARRVCKAVHTLMDGKGSQWISVDDVAREINVTDYELVEGAIAHAEHEGWLMIGGTPVHSVLLTPAGEQVASKIKWQPSYSLRKRSSGFVSAPKKKVRAKIKK